MHLTGVNLVAHTLGLVHIEHVFAIKNVYIFNFMHSLGIKNTFPVFLDVLCGHWGVLVDGLFVKRAHI